MARRVFQRLTVSLAVVAAAWFSVDGRAATVLPTSLDVLWAEADLVVHGHVVATSAERVPHAGQHLRSRHTVVLWSVLGSNTRSRDVDATGWVEVVMPGGSLDGLTTWVPGVPRLTPGDEVVLWLTWTPWGYQPMGYGLGTWRVNGRGHARPVARSPVGRDHR